MGSVRIPPTERINRKNEYISKYTTSVVFTIDVYAETFEYIVIVKVGAWNGIIV